MGAIETETIVPLGIRTGSADANKVMIVQKTSPAPTPKVLGGWDAEISGLIPRM
jgi:hypothetical protein